MAVKAQLFRLSQTPVSLPATSSMTSSSSISTTSSLSSPVSVSSPLVFAPPISAPSSVLMPSTSDPAAILLDMADTPNLMDSEEAAIPPGGMSHSPNQVLIHLRATRSALGTQISSSFRHLAPDSNPIPLGSAIEAQLKSRIIKGLYVPIDVILVSDQGGNIDAYLRNTTHTPSNDSCNRTFYPTLNIDRWTDAFIIFASIWISAFPHQAMALLHYIHLIRSMAKNTLGPVWLAYNREFRIRRQTDPNLPWDSLHPQLYFQLIVCHSHFPTHFSSLPKKEPGAFRVIHDLSYPKGRSVNDLIPGSLTTVQYEDFDHVSHLIFSAGRCAFISKVDIQNAFRIIPIHPEDRHLFGFSWRNSFYVDN